MRRSFTVTLAAIVLAVVVGAAPVAADNPHFVPSAWSGVTDQYTGDFTVGYMVAGLGNDTGGYVTTKGWFRMECQNNANLNNKKWTRRTVEHFVFPNTTDGMSRNFDALHANPCTNRNFSGLTIEWACVSATLRPAQGSGTVWDEKIFDLGNPDSPKCDRLR